MRNQALVIIASRVLGSGLQGVLLILLARSLGPIEYGRLSLVLAVGYLVFVASDLGMSTALSKWVAQDEVGKVAGALKLNIVSTAAVGLIFGVILLLLTGAQSLGGWYLLIVVAMAMEKMVETALSLPIANGDVVMPSLSIIIRRSFTLVCFIILTFAGHGAFISYAIGFTVGSMGGLVHRYMAIPAVRASGEPHTSLSLVKECVPYLVSNAGAQLRQLDVPIVSAIAGDAPAGLYSAAQRITSPFAIIPTTLAQVVLPQAARSSAGEARAVSKRLLLLAFGLGCVITLSLPFVGVPFVFLLGSEYEGAVPALLWALSAIPLVGLASPLGSLLQGQGRQRFVAINGVATGIGTIVLLCPLTWVWGATGAAAAIFCAFLVKVVLLAWRIGRLES